MVRASPWSRSRLVGMKTNLRESHDRVTQPELSSRLKENTMEQMGKQLGWVWGVLAAGSLALWVSSWKVSRRRGGLRR